MVSDLPGEFDIIETYFSRFSAGEPGAYSLTDDAAALAVPAGYDVVVTTDGLVSGIHFLEEDPPASIAYKALAVNGSDLAAMGAAPRAYTLALALSPGLAEQWLREFTDGISDYLTEIGGDLIGGDTVATTGPLTLTVTAIGTVPAGRALRRSGACPGEDVFVSGTIGDARLGLDIAKGIAGRFPSAARDFLVDRFRRPTPRIQLGKRLVGLASAAIDISDGLIADFAHVCRRSGLAGAIRLADVPLSKAAADLVSAGDMTPEKLVSGGDDYELLFTMPPGLDDQIGELSKELGLPITRIGSVSAVDGTPPVITIVDGSGTESVPDHGGYRHF